MSIADCEGTITVTDDDMAVLATADFDCETASVSVECVDNVPVATISADDTSTVNYSVDYSDGCTDESGSVDLSGSTDSAEVTLQNCSGTITITDDDGTTLASDTFEACCPSCPSSLAVKFDSPKLCDPKQGFTITEIDSESDPSRICFASETDYCELKVCVKAGQDEFPVLVTPSTDSETEGCGIDENVPEYCFDVSGETRHGISHFTIRCPDSGCVFTGGGSGWSPSDGGALPLLRSWSHHSRVPRRLSTKPLSSRIRRPECTGEK